MKAKNVLFLLILSLLLRRKCTLSSALCSPDGSECFPDQLPGISPCCPQNECYLQAYSKHHICLPTKSSITGNHSFNSKNTERFEGRIAKKTKSSSKDFTRRSAEESFRSLVKTHEKYGWVTPPLADG